MGACTQVNHLSDDFARALVATPAASPRGPLHRSPCDGGSTRVWPRPTRPAEARFPATPPEHQTAAPGTAKPGWCPARARIDDRSTEAPATIRWPDQTAGSRAPSAPDYPRSTQSAPLRPEPY